MLTRAEEKIYENARHIECYLPCDAFACFCFLNPELHIKKQSIHHAAIELHSYHTRGQLVLDHLKRKEPNVTIIEEFNQVLFMKFLIDIKDNF